MLHSRKSKIDSMVTQMAARVLGGSGAATKYIWLQRLVWRPVAQQAANSAQVNQFVALAHDLDRTV